MFPSTPIDSVQKFMEQIKNDTSDWQCSGLYWPWFRGLDNEEYVPIPSVFRGDYNETDLTATFRNRAPSLGKTPDRGSLDKWLFLMQHVGAPTRLLDWTEGALIALYFAVYKLPKTSPAVWMINPLELNSVSTGVKIFQPTWTEGPVLENIRIAFGTDGNPSKFPIAIQTTYIHPRMSAQKSCFTIHGSIPADFERLFENTKLVKDGYFRKYVIKGTSPDIIVRDLRTLGITFSTIFPDLYGLAKELKGTFLGL